jgi:hypothetical protein
VRIVEFVRQRMAENYATILTGLARGRVKDSEETPVRWSEEEREHSTTVLSRR